MTSAGRLSWPQRQPVRGSAIGKPASAPSAPSLPSLPNLEPLSLEPGQLGSELIVEVETNRPMVHGHALDAEVPGDEQPPHSLRCDPAHEAPRPGRLVEQDDADLEQHCQLHRRGDQHVFSFPFLSLRPGYIVVQELRVLLTLLENPGKTITYELPDQSLFVHVSDPSLAAGSPGVVISGGIHIDFSKLEEVYGSDIKSLLNLNAARGRTGPARHRVAADRPAPPPGLAIAHELRLNLPGGVALELVRIRAGEFMMGSPEDQGKDDERPQHLVRITRDFYLGKFPVTQEQFQAILGSNPSRFAVTKRHPVDNVSWEDAREFCRKLKAHLLSEPTALGQNPPEVVSIGLPTEAEWEYACRAGTRTVYSFGDDPKELFDHGWFDKNSHKTTQAVGQLRPNAWSLYDMHGNVWEWCDDFYKEDYTGLASDDPKGPSTGDRRVLRGGSWSCYGKQCRSACRHAVESSSRTANYGFRIVGRPKVNSS